jgi:hypothetical protein
MTREAELVVQDDEFRNMAESFILRLSAAPGG